MKTILLGVSASIAAYKAADLISELSKRDYQVDIVMTPNSAHFITPLALQAMAHTHVHLDVLGESDPHHISHIALAKTADLFIVAPATANTIAKLAFGFGDNMVTTTALAIPPETPKLIAPAMNTQMFNHPAVQNNLKTLESYGYQIVDPRSSRLACGDLGKGALAAVDDLVAIIDKQLA